MNAFHFPTTGVSVQKQAMLLAVDDFLLPFRNDLCLYLSKPDVRPEPVLTPRDVKGAPDRKATHFYGTVLHDEGRFRMWYYPLRMVNPDAEPEGNLIEWSGKNFTIGPVSYAESADGLTWERPVLGQVEIEGSFENNCIKLQEDCPIEGAMVIKEDDDPHPERRYKMAFNGVHLGLNTMTARLATSADGIHWKVSETLPRDCFLEHASFYHFNGLYVIHGQNSMTQVCSEGGGNTARTGVAWLSPDFDRWMPEFAVAFALPEPENPGDRGNTGNYDQVHIGVGAAPFGNVVIGFYCKWANRANPPEDWFGLGTTYGDLGLVISNDGYNFREPVKGHVYLNRHDSAPPPPPDGGHEVVLCQANGILNVGDKTLIYHGRWRNPTNPKHEYAEVGLATLPRDRWGALGINPDKNYGSLISAPISLPDSACSLFLNADGVSSIKVEVMDERFHLLPEFSGDNAGRCEVDGLDCLVKWPGAELARLAGKTVRLRIHLHRPENGAEPRLFAVYLRD